MDSEAEYMKPRQVSSAFFRTQRQVSSNQVIRFSSQGASRKTSENCPKQEESITELFACVILTGRGISQLSHDKKWAALISRQVFSEHVSLEGILQVAGSS